MTSYFDIIMIPLQVMIVFFTITILSCLYSESCLEKRKENYNAEDNLCCHCSSS